MHYIFLANTGGLLGLFMGFSVLSIVEILYFTSLRPFCELRKQKKFLRKKQNSLHVQKAWYENKNDRKIEGRLKSTMNTKNAVKGFINYAKSSLTLKKEKNKSNDMYPYFD